MTVRGAAGDVTADQVNRGSLSEQNWTRPNPAGDRGETGEA